MVRSQGRRRYYAARLTRDDRFQIIRVYDDETQVLADEAFPRPLEHMLKMVFIADGNRLNAQIGALGIEAVDNAPNALDDGGIGLMVTEGSVSAEVISIQPA